MPKKSEEDGNLKWPLKVEEFSSPEAKSKPKKSMQEKSSEEERVHIFGPGKKPE